jgi:hypothetical protein
MNGSAGKLLAVNVVVEAAPGAAALLLEYFFDSAQFLLDFAGDLFDFTFRREARVVGHLARLRLETAFQFVNLALYFILRTIFH